MAQSDLFEKDVEEMSLFLEKFYKKIEGKTFLITGGSGFIGTYLVETLSFLNKHKLKKPCRVISCDNYITSVKSNKISTDKNIKHIKRDVKIPFKVNGAINYIIHAAGIASPVYYQKHPLETIDVAVSGTRNMLELAKIKKVESFLFFSSSEIYGDPNPNSIPTKETYNGNVSSTGPRSCYDESKRLGETLCTIYFNLFKIPVKIIRPFNVFGPGMNHTDYRVIPTFVYNGIHNKEILIHSDGLQTRTFCYVTDAIRAFLMILFSNRNGQVYNVGNDKNEITMNNLAKLLNEILENKIKVRHVGYAKNYPQDEPRRRCPDLKKIKKEIGYSPKVDLKTGLSRTLDWSKKNWT